MPTKNQNFSKGPKSHEDNSVRFFRIEMKRDNTKHIKTYDRHRIQLHLKPRHSVPKSDESRIQEMLREQHPAAPGTKKITARQGHFSLPGYLKQIDSNRVPNRVPNRVHIHLPLTASVGWKGPKSTQRCFISTASSLVTSSRRGDRYFRRGKNGCLVQSMRNDSTRRVMTS